MQTTVHVFGNANRSQEIWKLCFFVDKYRSLYNRVPNNDESLKTLRDMANTIEVMDLNLITVFMVLIYYLILWYYMDIHPTELLKSIIIHNDNKASLSTPDNNRGKSIFNSICQVLDHVNNNNNCLKSIINDIHI